MDGKRFDDLTEALAAVTSRRRVLRLLGGGLATGLAASLGMRETTQAKGGSECKALCASLFPKGKERNQCISQGAKGQGPCAVPVDPCAGVTCSNTTCSTGSCVGGSCVSSVANQYGACTTDTGQVGTCSWGTCMAPLDLCAGVDCSSLNNACNTGFCDRGECYSAWKDGPCTTAAGQAGTCANGRCAVPFDPCAGIDCSSLDNACNSGFCNDGYCYSQPANDSDPCSTANGQPGICSAGTCVHNGVCESGVICSGTCCVNTGQGPLLCSGGPVEQCTCYTGGFTPQPYFC